ncbi:Rha family transcriptional regulator (plasmid) [Entomospira nematocerorum]|uniref:Rha family transcriptional regulator n=1 Tax=Entomospira nematocerorum TaxID=2719987 RepID=A0A968KTL0_9SPIO|nr:Rha family transcriptional regulator [Entomospira nematocera]NIZ47790.1 Rha family transcriptional regulator [Entomospira nematocera]WDI34768.1 Rha family transcriptional regulator [Entomospira nematocera]
MREITVWQAGHQDLTSSRNVAEVFGKEHKNVLRDIEELLPNLDNEFRSLNFELSEYTSGEGNFQKVYREYLLTKDGFTLLAMGFTGKRALQFKVAYIQAFNQLLYDRMAQAEIDSKINQTLNQLIDRQEAMHDHMQDAMESIESELKKAKRYIGKANANMQMIQFHGHSSHNYRQEIHSLADSLGAYCQQHNRMNPAMALESPKPRKSRRRG